MNWENARLADRDKRKMLYARFPFSLNLDLSLSLLILPSHRLSVSECHSWAVIEYNRIVSYVEADL